MAGRTTLGQLREQAQPWLSRPARRPAEEPVVDSPDRADLAVWDKIRSESALLRTLESRLAKDYGVEGLVGDLWMAAYARSPQLLAPDEVTPRQRSRRAVAAAMLGTAEHRELRETSVGDAYASALAVLSMGTDLQLMLGTLDKDKAARAERHARRETDRCAKDVRARFKDAQASAAEHDADDEGSGSGGDLAGADADRDDASPGDAGEAGSDGAGEPADGPVEQGPEDMIVPRPEAVDLQRAVMEAQAAEQDEATALAALAALGEGDEAGEQASMTIRATAREALAAAAEEVAAHESAMTAWGLGTQVQERLDPDARLKLAEELNTRKLKMFAELIGRFAQLAQAQRARRVEHARGEYVGVSIGDDLGSLIPAELVNLAVPALRASFAARYAEQQLMIYEQRGDEHEGQGAIIACVDVSGSMGSGYGTGYTAEAYAKAMALALLDQARAARPVRECVVILFAGTVTDVFRFPADRPVDPLDRVRLAAAPLAGGTQFTEPLQHAVRLLDEEFNAVGRQRGDIVFITDGHCWLREEFLEWWHAEKKRLGFRCFGVQVENRHYQSDADEAAARVLGLFCDDARAITDFSDTHATADIYRAV